MFTDHSLGSAPHAAAAPPVCKFDLPNDLTLAASQIKSPRHPCHAVIFAFTLSLALSFAPVQAILPHFMAKFIRILRLFVVVYLYFI